MHLYFVEIKDINSIADNDIRERAAEKRIATAYHHFVAKDGEKEIGFLSVDIHPNVDFLVVYEVFVPKNHRHKGYGARLMAEAERIAVQNSRDRIVLSPEPFERDYSKKNLLSWYQRLGFKKHADTSDELEKIICDQ